MGVCAHVQKKIFSRPGMASWTPGPPLQFLSLVVGPELSEARFPIIPTRKEQGLSEMEDLHFIILYNPLVPQLNWLLRR
jgi:hypothetical protein